MKIGVSTAAYYGRLETEDAAAHLASLDIPCCEVFLETYSEYTRDFGALVHSRLGKTRALSVHAKTQHFETDFMGQSARQRKDAFRMFDSFLQAGHALGAHIYVYHGPAAVRAGIPDFSRWQEGIGQAIEMAQGYAIDFSWETVSWCHLNSPARVAQFRKMWPALHFVLDIKQVLQLGHRPVEYIDAMGDRLRHVHVLDRDANGNNRLPGEGCFDFAGLARDLRAHGYQGDVILEPYGSQVTSDDVLLRAVHHLEHVFLEAGEV